MKNMNLLPVVAVLGLGACAAQVPPDSTMSKIEFEYKAKQIETQIDIMPKWYTEIPSEDDAVYAVGTAITPDLQLAVDIATLSAKTTLADRIDSKLRSQMKTFKGKVGADDFANKLTHEFEQATINIIADADVAGYRVKETSIVPNGTQYRAYVLLEYTDSEASKIMVNRLAQQDNLLSKLQAKSAWSELNAKVNAMNDAERKDVSIIADAISNLPDHTPAPIPETTLTVQ